MCSRESGNSGAKVTTLYPYLDSWRDKFQDGIFQYKYWLRMPEVRAVTLEGH